MMNGIQMIRIMLMCVYVWELPPPLLGCERGREREVKGMLLKSRMNLWRHRALVL